MLFINQISHEDCINKIYPGNFKELRRRANVLDSLGYLRPALIKSRFLQKIEGDGSGTINCGSFDKLIRLNDTLYTASGLANMPGTKGPADAVLLTYDNMLGKSLPFTMENADSLNWKINFSTVYMPYDPIIIKAWAFDANSGKAYRLKGDYTINR